MKPEFLPADNFTEIVEASRYGTGVGFTVRTYDVDRLIKLYNILKKNFEGEPGYNSHPPETSHSASYRRGR
jgi:hypothetical protein